MAYKIIISLRAQKEIENALEYYALYSKDTPLNFVAKLKEAYNTLSANPFCRVRYRNVRALKMSKFPYTFYFVVNRSHNSINVLSCFHNKMNPKKRP